MKTPLLSTVCRILAWMNALAGVLGAIGVADRSGAIALCYACGGLLMGVVLAGIAEAIEYLAATAYYAKQTYELQRGNAPAGNEDPSADLLRDALR